MKKYVSLILLLIASTSFAQEMADPIEVFDKLLLAIYKPDTDTIPKASEIKPAIALDSLSLGQDESFNQKYEGFLMNAKKQELAETKFKGKLNFGLTLNNSQNNDLTQFNISANIQRGFFPGQLKFNSDLTIQIRNGSFVENFSNLFMAYDHHIGNKPNYEGYMFIKRSTNIFLNINQRYEAGSGLVWNVYTSGKYAKKENTEKENERKLTEKGAEKFKRITEFQLMIKEKNGSLGLEETDNENFFLELCKGEQCSSKRAKLSAEEEKVLKKSLNRTINSIKKMESKVRLSFLLGVNYETEKTSNDLKLFGSNTDTIGNFAPVNLFRLVTGPNIELQLDQFSFKSKLYFKMGISDDDLTDKVFSEDNLFEDSKVNYRVEWMSTASIKFSKKISITGSYTYVHINAPRRHFISTPDSTQLFSAANRFSNFKMGLTYSF